MKKIKTNSYLELEKSPEIITNINRLISKPINKDYINEYRKYLLTAVKEGYINSNNDYIINLDNIKLLSAIYTFSEDGLDNLIAELINNELLILNSDKTYSFNEDAYKKDLVEAEKTQILLDKKYPLIYIKSPWTFYELKECFLIEGYSDILQENTDIATISKLDDGSDNIRKLELQNFIPLPEYFEIIKSFTNHINDLDLKTKVKDFLNYISNFNLEYTEITCGDEYDRFLENKLNDCLEVLDISEWMETFGAFDIVDKYDTLASVFANDINMEELFGCMTLMIHRDELYSLILDIATHLPKDNDIYIQIAKLIGEDTIEDWRD